MKDVEEVQYNGHRKCQIVLREKVVVKTQKMFPNCDKYKKCCEEE